MQEFISFNKIARLSREIVISEKLDGTSSVIYISDDGEFQLGSRNRWITPEDDNLGFAKWAHENKEQLLKLGSGWHHGEWWGVGIGRNYGLKEKRFSLFNSSRWTEETLPSCCYVVPILYKGKFDTIEIDNALNSLIRRGSAASPNYMNPEGIIIYHTAAKIYFKKTCKNDEKPKGSQE